MSEIRDHKVDWVNEATGSEGRRYYLIKQDYLQTHHLAVNQDILERDPEDDSGDFLMRWHDKANDAVIEGIDWSQLNICKHCDKYFEPDWPEDEFCSEDCTDVFMTYQD